MPGVKFRVAPDCEPTTNEAKMEVQFMRLLCSGSDVEKLERTRRELVSAGIACELRRDIATNEKLELPSYPETWIKMEKDFSRAVHVFSRLASAL
jgi:hypothetical protein